MYVLVSEIYGATEGKETGRQFKKAFEQNPEGYRNFTIFIPFHT